MVHELCFPSDDASGCLYHFVSFQALVGYEGSQHYHVFELTRQLPRFSMYAVLVEPTQNIKSSVSFIINERLQRVSNFINLVVLSIIIKRENNTE